MMKFRWSSVGVALLIFAAMLTNNGAVLVQAQPESSEGVWRTEGYGMVFDFDADGLLTLYQETGLSCIQVFDKLAPEMLDLTVTVEGDRLVVRDAMTLYFGAVRLPELPANCADGGTAPTDDPEFNFEVFWTVFDEHYAFFDLHGVDWQAQYDAYRPQVSPEIMPDDLFAIFSDMLAPLDDGHINLFSDDDDYSPGSLPAWGSDIDTLLTVLVQAVSVLGESYLGSDLSLNLMVGLVGDDALFAYDNMVYGALSDTVGYVNIFEMEDYESPEPATAGAALDRVLAELGDKETLIVDVRFNGGGHDAVALALAGRFADQERLVYTKHARHGDGVTLEREFHVVPAGPVQYSGNVIVLTSRMSASATEIFVMAMRVLPNVTLVGEPTSGGLSDMLDFQLPNGWVVTLSNETYTAADGELYEGRGVPPDVEVSLDPDQLFQGVDNILETALALAEK